MLEAKLFFIFATNVQVSPEDDKTIDTFTFSRTWYLMTYEGRVEYRFHGAKMTGCSCVTFDKKRRDFILMFWQQLIVTWIVGVQRTGSTCHHFHSLCFRLFVSVIHSSAWNTASLKIIVGITSWIKGLPSRKYTLRL